MTYMRHSLTQHYDPKRGVCIATFAVDYPRGSVTTAHAHGADQLIYATRGVMNVYCGRSLWLIPPHFGLWIPARMPHQIHMPEPVSMRTLYIRRALVNISPACTVLHAPGLLRELIVEIVRLGRLRRAQLVERALSEVLISELERAPVLPTTIDLPIDRRALAVAHAVMDNATTNMPLKSLCAAAGVSARTLQRLYRRDVGADFESWRRQWRLMKAIELLVAGYTVKAVAATIGYRHAGAFVVLFKQAFGATPKAWIQTLEKLK